jgi:PIN domain nuclease of toxin-antitoxin system
MLLDTHAWVWWMSDPDKLPGRARKALDREAERSASIGVSCISTWEVAMLVAAGRLILTLDLAEWLGRAGAVPFVEFVPVDNQVALRSVRLPEFPNRDPADRLIVATAIGLGATLVSGDHRILEYPRVRTLWD